MTDKDSEELLRKVRESLSPRGSTSQGANSFGTETPPPPFPLHPLESELPVAYPVDGKPGFYIIDGMEFGPDSKFSDAITRLKGRPYLRAKAYVIAEYLRTHGQLACDIIPGQEHYLTEEVTEVHHTKSRTLHVARTLTPACHKHNSRHGPPKSWAGSGSSETVEREKFPREPETLTPGEIAAAPAVLKLNIDLYPVFCRYLRDRIGQEKELQAKSFVSDAAKYMRKQTGHGSKQSAQNYMDLETSSEGEYDVVEGVIRPREKKAKLSKEHLSGHGGMEVGANKRQGDLVGETSTVERPSSTEDHHA